MCIRDSVSWLTGHPPNTQYPNGLSADGLPEPPSSQYLLGTDSLGRDLLVRIAYGARVSLIIGVVATMLTVTIGAVVGLLAGYFGGIVDTILSRLLDAVSYTHLDVYKRQRRSSSISPMSG